MTSPSMLPKPNAAIGFMAFLNGSNEAITRGKEALEHALAHFNDIQQLTINLGPTTLTIWGRGQLENSIHQLPDGSHFILFGSPVGNHTWQSVGENLFKASPGKFDIPWEGRVILLRIEPQGHSWTLWNDWMGSIPIYYSQKSGGVIASTLEPVVVNAVGVSGDDVHLPSLLALLLWGHYYSNWTLFKHIHVVRPDCEAHWSATELSEQIRYSIPMSDAHWQSGWDDLMDEMHYLSKKAITAALDQHPQWILPLSSGLDSRLIAGVAAEQNKNVFTYTWGSPGTTDVIQAKKIARTLGLPWKSVPPGEHYLKDYKTLWISLFGTSMHFHGMYQMPFLDALCGEPAGPIASGFIGECLSGYDTKILCEGHSVLHPFQLLPDGYLHWKLTDLPTLLTIPYEDALDELAAEVNYLAESPRGALHHRLRFGILWGRQRFFTYFQSMMSDYWRGVSTPYMDREYARFSFSLPRAILDDRILQQAMLSRYYPKLASIPGTYAPEPALLSGSYLIKKRICRYMPGKMARKIFPELYRIRSETDVACVRNDGYLAFGSLFEPLSVIDRWINCEIVEKTYRQIIEEGNMVAVRKLQSLETLAYRLSTK